MGDVTRVLSDLEDFEVTGAVETVGGLDVSHESTYGSLEWRLRQTPKGPPMTDPRQEQFRQWLGYTEGIDQALTSLLVAASTLRTITEESRRVLEPASRPTSRSQEMATALEASGRLQQRLREAASGFRAAYNELHTAIEAGP